MTVLFDLSFALRQWTEAESGRGTVCLPVDVKFDDRNVYAPDVLWYAEGRVPSRHDQPPSPMPDIAAEIRSPSTWRYDIGAKKSGYERTFDVALELGIGDGRESPLLPGFALAVNELFGG